MTINGCGIFSKDRHTLKYELAIELTICVCYLCCERLGKILPSCARIMQTPVDTCYRVCQLRAVVTISLRTTGYVAVSAGTSENRIKFCGTHSINRFEQLAAKQPEVTSCQVFRQTSRMCVLQNSQWMLAENDDLVKWVRNHEDKLWIKSREHLTNWQNPH